MDYRIFMAPNTADRSTLTLQGEVNEFRRVVELLDTRARSKGVSSLLSNAIPKQDEGVVRIALPVNIARIVLSEIGLSS